MRVRSTARQHWLHHETAIIMTLIELGFAQGWETVDDWLRCVVNLRALAGEVGLGRRYVARLLEGLVTRGQVYHRSRVDPGQAWDPTGQTEFWVLCRPAEHDGPRSIRPPLRDIGGGRA